MTLFFSYLTMILIKILTLVMCWEIGETVNDVMTSLTSTINDTDDLSVQEIDSFKTAVLICRSNDKKHFFNFWVLPKDEVIVGPANKFDSSKYDYEVLSGNLTIRHATKEEEGIYHCVSKGVNNNDVNIRSVRMVINTPPTEDNQISYFRGVVVVGTLLIISGIIYGVYRMIKNRHKEEMLLAPTSDDEDSGDEIFIAPGTSKQSDTVSFIRRSREMNPNDHIEIPKISIDFEDILENTQK